MISLQTTPDLDRALQEMTHNGILNRSDIIREAIFEKYRKPTSRALNGIDVPTAKKSSHALLQLLSLIVTGLEADEPDVAMELVVIVENRMRNWREDRQTADEQMETALEHVLGVMERLPEKKRAKVMAGAVERMQERFS
jgi:hypothetical protein